MTNTSRGLGKGLNALLTQSTPEQAPEASPTGTGTSEVQHISLAAIHPNPHQPRRTFTEKSLAELAQSITEQGVLQPVLLRPTPEGYELVAGERRWRACQTAGLETIPALVRELSDGESLVLALLENLQREDLNPLEEAQALDRLQGEMGVSQAELANQVCKSRSAVANSLRLLQLDEPIRQAVLDAELSAGNARTLMGVSETEPRLQLFEIVLGQALTVRQTEKIVAYWKEHGVFPPQFAPKASASSGSPKQPDRFLQDVQDVLRQRLPAKIHLRGGREKGKISLQYESSEQLEQILALLGIENGSVSRETPPS